MIKISEDDKDNTALLGKKLRFNRKGLNGKGVTLFGR